VTGNDAVVDLHRLRLRPLRACGAGVIAVVIVSLIGLPSRDGDRATPALLLVLPVLFTAIVGGTVPGIVIALVAGLTLVTVFFPPLSSPVVELGEDVLALAVFLVVAFAVSGLVGLTLEAERRRLAADEARLALLQAGDEHRRELLRAVSHELRTPLGIVRATASELLDAEAAHDEATQRRLLALLMEETARLDRIVANLLAMSRIDADAWRPERHEIAVEEAVTAAVQRLADTTPAARVTVAVDPEVPPVLADPVQLDLVLGNLLENAVRHSPPGEAVSVAAHAEGGRVAIAVTDHGVGVDPTLGERAFEPFVKGPGGSTGLGLALCRTIVSSHGGTIDLRGAPGGGTVAVVTFPTV
jgi:two-component system sensor histidine kinase KdpD